MITKNVSRVIVKENNFPELSGNIISEEKLSKFSFIVKELLRYCFGNDDFYKKDMNNLALIKTKSQQYHSIL